MDRIANLSIAVKMTLVVAVPLLFLLVLAYASLTAIDELLDNHNSVIHSNEVRISIISIGRYIVDLETGERGFLISGKQEFLEPFNDAQIALDQLIANTKALVSDNLSQVKRLERIEALIERWYQEASGPEIRLRERVNQSDIGSVDLQAQLGAGTGKTILDDMRQRFAKMNKQFAQANNKEAQNIVLRLAKAMVDMETGQRGFLITGLPEYLAPFETGADEFDLAGAQLNEIFDDAYNRRLMKDSIDNMERLSQQWYQDAAVPFLSLRALVNQGSKTTKELEKEVKKATGKALLDKFRQQQAVIITAFERARNQRAQTIMQQIGKAMIDQETGVRGYLITGDDSFLEPHKRGRQALSQSVIELRSLLANAYNVPQMRRTLKTVQERALDWNRDAAQPEIATRRSINTLDVTIDDVTALIEAGTGKSIIDALRLILAEMEAEENRLRLIRQSQSDVSSNQLEMVVIAGTIAVLLLSIVVARALITNIINRLQFTVEAVERIANSDYSHALEVSSHDQIGQLATSINRLLGTLKNVITFTKRIAQGRYDIDFSAEGAEGELADALSVMSGTWAENQRTLEIERSKLESEDWIKTSYATLLDKMQTADDMQVFADFLLTTLVPLLDAHVGLFYQFDKEGDNRLTLLTSYAYRQRKHLSNEFALGEGLIGQCALEKKMIVLSKVPDDYITISSGAGESTPVQIVVFPVEFDGRLLSVIEIGTAAELTTNQLSLLELLQANIGVIVNNIYGRISTEVLLEKSQTQGLELQRQQEELQAANENLEEQTQQLKKSEAVLKQQGEELTSSNEELREQQELLRRQKEAVEAAKQDVDIKADELALASKYKSEFLANMSHELRTPLNSLLILSKSLANNKEGNLTDKQCEDARIVHEGGNDLLLLINDIMDLSKVEAGMLDVNMDQVQLAAMAGNLDSMFGRVADDKGVEFSTTIDKDLPATIFSDSQRIEQILKNFLSNALKFTETGFVKLHFHAINPQTQFRQANLTPESGLAVSVIDSGVGIPVAKQQAIFEAFQQEDGSTSRKYGGTGLGLTISRGLAQLLGGEIHLLSDKGEGSTFTLYIPSHWDEAIHSLEVEPDAEAGENTVKANRIAQPNSSPQSEAVGQTTAPLGWLPDDRKNIQSTDNVLLIIEDDESFAKILLNLGHNHGQKVLLANKGRDGLLLALEYNPCGILLDLGLPDISGLQVLEQLKDSLETRHIPVHVISGADNKTPSLERGALSFVAKPASAEAIDVALENIKSIASSEVKTILVVEDDKNGQKAINRLLESKDIKLSFAGDLARALQLLDAHSYDCIILDLGLPDAQGASVLKQVVEHDNNENTPIIVYTGREISDAEHKVLAEFSASIVIKGAVSPERLLDDVSLFLHRTNQELSNQQQQTIKMLHDQDAMLSNRRVLLVDDDMRNVYALKSELGALGLQVTPAENGQVAVDKVKASSAAQAFDLILMDIMMPIKDGYEAMQEIRQLPAYANTPILALTAKAMPEDRQKCIDAGASDYITKPINIEKLSSMLRVWLYQRS